ncbi:MAG: ATP phosphoribosyltransferase regulatory subunit [Pyrinomonadaceae bacterium]|nr:ATP phosphoribosyltransferase regulatory subunit [Pyrinomonadaceae bacterium]
MSEPLSKIPSGMRYYFGQEARLRRAVEDAVVSVFTGWSYEEITTPSVDYYALFERGMGREEAHRAVRFMDGDGRLLALRPDMTSSVARAAATLFAERPRPLRFCYAAPVFRQQPHSHAEWRRESTQLGCELIGPGGAAADMEVLAIAVEVLAKLGLWQHCSITLNSVEVFNGIAEGLALDPAARDEMRRLIDMRDAAELGRFLTPRTSSATERAAFGRLTQLSGKRETLHQARRVITNKRSTNALDELEQLWKMIEALNLTDRFEIDLGDVLELDYYTGLVFRIYISGAGTRVGRGGRYDSLTANFGRTEPAIGFVLDLEALTDVLAKTDSAFAGESNKPNEVVPLACDDEARLLVEATERRRRGERIRIDFASES